MFNSPSEKYAETMMNYKVGSKILEHSQK